MKSKSSGKLILLIGGGATILLSCSCCVLAMVMGTPDPADQMARQQAGQETVAGQEADPATTTGIRVPNDPEPPSTARATEVPRLESELASIETYGTIWNPDRREDLNVLLTGVSQLLTAGGFARPVTTALEERGLRDAAINLFMIHARVGHYPQDFNANLIRHLESVREHDGRGVWSTWRDGQPPHDFTALAAWIRRTDPVYFREHLVARAAHGWEMPPDGAPRFPYLSRERDALQRLDRLTDLSDAEERRLDFLRIPHRVGDRVEHAGVAWTVREIETRQSIGPRGVRLRAPTGATYVVVDFEAETLGNETETVVVDRFKLIDRQGREFSSSNQATVRLLASRGGSGDWLLSQLQPGVVRRTAVVFEVPAGSAFPWFTLVLPGGFLGSDTKIAVER